MTDKQTVHALKGGRTACNFMDGAPASEWPSGHVWMALVAYGCSPGFDDKDAIREMGGEPCSLCVDVIEKANANDV